MATILDDERRELAEAEQRFLAALRLERRSERLTLPTLRSRMPGCSRSAKVRRCCWCTVPA
jgi:hypothetical protein